MAYNPGDYVEGEVYTISQSGNTITWYMEMYDGDGTWVYSEANSYGYQWTQAYVGILEAYNITLCSQFPDNYIPYEFWDTELYSNPGYTLNSYGNGFTGMLYAYNNNMSPSYQGPNCGWSGSYLNLGADGDGWVFAF